MLEHRMSVMAARATVDPTPVIRHLREHEESAFDDALAVLTNTGMTDSEARDAVWQLLSRGLIEFTTDRRLRLPARTVPAAAG